MGKYLEKYDERKRFNKIITNKVTPYNIYELKNRRRRKINNYSVSPSSSYRNETTSFEDAAISSLTSCCSSSSSSEFIQNFVVVKPEVDESNGEITSSKFVDCNNNEAREVETSKLSDGFDLPAKESTVEIKSITTMPLECDIEEFFCSAENELQKRFLNKYNFDIVKDVPLEGRYEWVEITKP